MELDIEENLNKLSPADRNTGYFFTAYDNKNGKFIKHKSKSNNHSLSIKDIRVIITNYLKANNDISKDDVEIRCFKAVFVGIVSDNNEIVAQNELTLDELEEMGYEALRE